MRREDEDFGKKSRREDQEYPLERDLGNSFDDEREILNYRPKIEWEPPPSEEGEEVTPGVSEEIEKSRQRAEAIIEGYDRITQITDAIQKKIDDKVKKLGGLEISLDPKKDAATISAMKRRFPDADPTKIDYDTYKKALACARHASPEDLPAVKKEDVMAARQNPTTTNFGGYGEKPGALRQELQNPNFGEPVDLEKFQKQATLDLFKMMESLIQNTAAIQVKIHEKKLPHVPHPHP